MVLKGIGRVHKKGKHGGVMIYVPADVAKDSQFPFRPGEKVLIEIDIKARALMIKRANSLSS